MEKVEGFFFHCGYGVVWSRAIKAKKLASRLGIPSWGVKVSRLFGLLFWGKEIKQTKSVCSYWGEDWLRSNSIHDRLASSRPRDPVRESEGNGNRQPDRRA